MHWTTHGPARNSKSSTNIFALPSSCVACRARLICAKKARLPRVLLAPLPEEMHVMGQIMTEAVLADQGANTVNAGSHMPINEMVVAAAAFRADVLALSISLARPKRRIRPALIRLRRLLPSRVQLWVEGRAGEGEEIITRPPKGTRIFSDLAASVTALHDLAEQQRD